MPTIELTQGQRARVDWQDYRELAEHRWCAQYKPGPPQAFYAIRMVSQPGIKSNLKISLRHTKRSPGGEARICRKDRIVSQELNQLFPVLPKGVTTPPGAVRIQLDGPDGANLVDVFGMFMALAQRRHGGFRGVVHEAQQRHEAQEKYAEEAPRTASVPTEAEPKPEAAAAATTEEVGEST